VLWSFRARTPPSYEAYAEYAEGQRWYAAGEWQQAWKHLERAFALDTMYLEALVEAAEAHGNANDFPGMAAHIRYIEQRRDRLTRAEQLIVEVEKSGVLESDFQRALVYMRELVTIIPRHAFDWGYYALLANRPAEAVHVFGDLFNDAPMSRSWAPWWWFFAHSYHMLGRHEDELRTARRGSALFPDQLLEVNAEIRADAALGRQPDVARLLDLARGMSPPPYLALEFWGGAGPWQPYEAALEFRAHGFPDAYRWAIQQMLERLRETAPRDTTAASWRYGEAVALYAAERWREARNLFAALRAGDPGNVDFIGWLGASEARLGHRAEAAALAGRLASLNPPYSFGNSLYWQARIAAVLGDRDGAVARLREALGQGMMCLCRFGPPWEDCHRDMDFESLRGYAPFDELLRPKG
jgi:tetratricopeptide (TPR) repeat protein